LALNGLALRGGAFSSKEALMTDRINALTVVLEKDLRDDDCEPLLDAIKQLRGVLSVVPHVAGIVSHLAETRAKNALREEVLALLLPKLQEP
jgi:hypothetical protein